MRKIMIFLVRTYQKYISPLTVPHCIYSPSCSQYMIEAVSKYGAWKGFWMGVRRISRCHPGREGGYDPVP